MSENETYASHFRNEINTIGQQNLKIDDVIDRSYTQDIKITLLSERISVLEKELFEIRHILSGRQFMQRSLSYEDPIHSE